MLDTADLDWGCEDNLKVMVHTTGRPEQGDQAQFDVGAVAVGDVFLVERRSHQFVMVAASPFALLSGGNLFMLVSTAEADDDTSLQAGEHALKHDGCKDKPGCDTKTHVSGSIR